MNEGCKIKHLIMGRKEDPEVYKSLSPFFNEGIEYIGEQTNLYGKFYIHKRNHSLEFYHL